MRKAGRGRRARGERRAAAPSVPEELLWEILVRLPAKDVLRCRAVCRSWCRLATSADFLLAHHRLQPALPLVSFHGELSEASVETFDLRRTPAERRPVLAFNDYSHRKNFTIHASCDGLLLLSLANHRFYICNPATRQCVVLPGLTGATVAALYPLRPSGEYRVLFWKDVNTSTIDAYYVLTVGSSEKPRCIGMPVASESMKAVLRHGIYIANKHLPVMLHGCLHMGPGCILGSAIIVFDPVAESFVRLMPPPTALSRANLHDIDGTLGISSTFDDRSGRVAKLWELQDYEMGIWSLKYQIKLPVQEMTRITDSKYYYVTVVSENGDVLIRCRHPWYLFHCDSKGKLVDKFLWDGVCPNVTGHWFKQSLVRHAFFQMQDGSCVRQPRFFRGL
ncbi:hypothetical protein OsI_14960 [Oryza sativa Indica Group]|uniref:F-box domain-containing protein n=1 Tax=Oryza sativa subsp. indica TaxID=39946 RepID=A2XQP4_ORYSI|nr:hypothetical protein OsI_14960 [Oryza sativa Indica Group]